MYTNVVYVTVKKSSEEQIWEKFRLKPELCLMNLQYWESKSELWDFNSKL